jgi:2-keto-3-deoxy-L-rhamnonate aldolase RhmA/quercetin dioxygenase-like cupin family protein
MKKDAIKRLRNKLAADLPTYGLWVTLESPSITEMAVGLGLDWVVIDAEHGHLDWKEIVEHLRATMRSDTVAFVGLSERSTVLTKRALDLGADGVVIPWVNTAEELAEAIRDARYPPQGRRGIGGERATVWGQCFREHALEANDHVLVVPKIESIAAVEHVSQMCQVEGVEIFFFGPADFSATAGHAGQWEGPGVAEQILSIHQTLQRHGKHAGIIGTSLDDLLVRTRQGFGLIALGTDVGLSMRTLRESLATVGLDRKPSQSLDPHDCQVITAALDRPPNALRPDRLESVAPIGAGETCELQQGVHCETLVGQSSGARGLSTGIVTFAPESTLDPHAHPASESITVLKGEVEVSVEGHEYRLGPLDNIVIPRWLPHAARNPSASIKAILHVAIATSAPERISVGTKFPRQAMPVDCGGRPGAERVTRYRTATWYSAGHGAELMDYFNAELVPGLEMSGGFGRFSSDGRLPAHCHDFDESICIIDGAALCRVEGREYPMSDCATAIVPRGRVHYFVNPTKTDMSMIWVYAGPMPQRVVVDERCATTEGCPWS